MIEFKVSETRTNLMRAFAGESQARNRYYISAQKAKKANLPIIHDVFMYTAEQEREHAEIFYNFLKQMSGEKITITGDYPVDNYDEIERLLRAAQEGETEEYTTVYPDFANKAREEGYAEIGAAFDNIAAIEKTHAERFAKFADLMQQDTLFTATETTMWICQHCGHIHTGPQAPQQCPVCHSVQGYFLRKGMAPYTQCDCENKQ